MLDWHLGWIGAFENAVDEVGSASNDEPAHAHCALVGGAFLALPLQVRAQQPGRMYRIGGLLSNPREAPQIIALFNELRRLGFIEGKT